MGKVEESKNFEIKIEKWVKTSSSDPCISATSAYIELSVNNAILSTAEDLNSKSVSNSVLLATYPLALWLLSSYWRLICEVGRSATSARYLDWKMSHNISAVGWGYVWPPISIDSDGQHIRISSAPSKQAEFESLRYISCVDELVTVDDFIKSVTKFIKITIMRLEACGVVDSELQKLWVDVSSEVASQEWSSYRRLEAAIGADPDEGDEAIMRQLVELMAQAGDGASIEIARAIDGLIYQGIIDEILRLSRCVGIVGGVDNKLLKKIITKASASKALFPWEIGRVWANAARNTLSIDGDRVDNDKLISIFGLNNDCFVMQEATGSGRMVPTIALAQWNRQAGDIRIHLRRRNETGRRFEIVRILADAVYSIGTSDKWLPVTDTASARQKIQRAFAAEFLCPIDKLLAYLGGDYSEAKQEDASEHFSVSPFAIKSHLVNNKAISRENADLWSY